MHLCAIRIQTHTIATIISQDTNRHEGGFRVCTDIRRALHVPENIHMILPVESGSWVPRAVHEDNAPDTPGRRFGVQSRAGYCFLGAF